MARIIPVRDLRDTTKISNMCKESMEPIYVTKNGYGEMVVMSLDAYEHAIAKSKMFDQIMEGKKQVVEGKVIDGDIAINEIGEKYDLI